MSGGYFDRSIYAMRDIADTMERDIARALQPKPEKEHENISRIWFGKVAPELTKEYIIQVLTEE